jgi:hypothetical protein
LCSHDKILVPSKSLKAASIRKQKIVTRLSDLNQHTLLVDLMIWRNQNPGFATMMQLPDRVLQDIARCPESFDANYEDILSAENFEGIGKLISNLNLCILRLSNR